MNPICHWPFIWMMSYIYIYYNTNVFFIYIYSTLSKTSSITALAYEAELNAVIFTKHILRYWNHYHHCMVDRLFNLLCPHLLTGVLLQQLSRVVQRQSCDCLSPLVDDSGLSRHSVSVPLLRWFGSVWSLLTSVLQRFRQFSPRIVSLCRSSLQCF